MTEEIKNMIEDLTQSLKKETEDTFKDTVDAVVREYPVEKMDLDRFSTLISYNILERLHDQLIERYFPETKWFPVLHDLVENYSFVEKIVKDLVTTIHGNPTCCADCSRWVLRQYFEYLKSDNLQLPDMTISDDCYWKPDFGTAQQWMDLCTSALFLTHGRAGGFCAAYIRLVMEGQKVYPPKI